MRRLRDRGDLHATPPRRSGLEGVPSAAAAPVLAPNRPRGRLLIDGSWPEIQRTASTKRSASRENIEDIAAISFVLRAQQIKQKRAKATLVQSRRNGHVARAVTARAAAVGKGDQPERTIRQVQRGSQIVRWNRNVGRRDQSWARHRVYHAAERATLRPQFADLYGQMVHQFLKFAGIEPSPKRFRTLPRMTVNGSMENCWDNCTAT